MWPLLADLVAQFLSPATNLRPPSSRFSLAPSAADHRPLGILCSLLRSIRRNTSPSFCVGIKLSCGDFVRGGLSEEDALAQVQAVREMTVDLGSGSSQGWDFVEISGGAYENPRQSGFLIVVAILARCSGGVD